MTHTKDRVADTVKGAEHTPTPKFEKTYCSRCGGEFGPGDSGYSHCDQHKMPLEVDVQGSGEGEYYAIFGDVGTGRAGVICDTLNCDHLITLDEQKKWMELIVTAVNSHATYREALREAQERLEDAVDTLEAMDLHADNPLYERLCNGLIRIDSLLQQKEGGQ